MTYLEFLAVFVLPVAVLGALLILWQRSALPAARSVHRVGLLTLALLAAAALVWTTPWDSWIIQHGVWSYPEGRVLGTFLHIPVEEFLFMLGQTAAVGLWALWLLVRSDAPAVVMSGRVRLLAAIGWFLAAALGVVLALTVRHATYLGTMLLWFGPPLALQNAVGADVLRANRALRIKILAPILLYWWTVDGIALGADIWRISSEHTIGMSIFGLPGEEAAFFVVTSALVGNGMLLAVHPVVRGRLTAFLPWPRIQTAVPE